jgi:hypothetical protein
MLPLPQYTYLCPFYSLPPFVFKCSVAQERYYGGIAVHLFCPVGGFGDLTLLDLDKGEGNRKENAYQDLVALPGMVGWSIPVRRALVVAGWVVTATHCSRR